MLREEDSIKQSPLSLFAENEAKIARLYELYAAKFPEHKKMWLLLANEEKRHAEILRHLEQDLVETDKFAALREHGWQILFYVRDFIDSRIAEAQAEAISVRQALNTSLSLEQSMIEKKSFAVFLPLSEEISKAMEKLNRETDGHARRLEKALFSLTPRSGKPRPLGRGKRYPGA